MGVTQKASFPQLFIAYGSAPTETLFKVPLLKGKSHLGNNTNGRFEDNRTLMPSVLQDFSGQVKSGQKNDPTCASGTAEPIALISPHMHPVKAMVSLNLTANPSLPVTACF